MIVMCRMLFKEKMCITSMQQVSLLSARPYRIFIPLLFSHLIYFTTCSRVLCLLSWPCAYVSSQTGVLKQSFQTVSADPSIIMWSTTQCFGPLVHLWTLGFEGKHCFSKRVIHNKYNFKNVVKTLTTRYQYIMAYHFRAHTGTNPAHMPQVSPLPKFPHFLKWQKTWQ